jgi:hypothetical protein
MKGPLDRPSCKSKLDTSWQAPLLSHQPGQGTSTFIYVPYSFFIRVSQSLCMLCYEGVTILETLLKIETIPSFQIACFYFLLLCLLHWHSLQEAGEWL